MILLWPGAGAALQVSFQGGGDLDVLVVSFESGQAQYGVRRVGRREVALTTEGERLEQTLEVQGALVAAVDPLENGLLLTLNTDEFGYIASPVSDAATGTAQLKLQLFRDPIGARWKPREGAAPVELRRVEPAADVLAATDTAATPLGAPEPAGPSLFSVPYSVRVHVNGGMDREILVEPGEVVEFDEDSGTVRIKAMDGGPREVGVAPPPDLARERLREKVAAQADAITAADLADRNQVGELGETTLPAEGPMVDQPLLPLDAAAVDAAMDEPAQAMPPPAESVDQRFFSRVMRSVTGTPEPVAEDSAEPEAATTDDAMQDDAGMMEAGMEPALDEGVAADLASMPEMEDEAIQGALEDIASGNGSSGQASGQENLDDQPLDDAPSERYAGLSEEDAKKMEALELRMLKAQSLVASGQLEEARGDFEDILADPILPPDLRLEAMYSLGGVLMTLYKDSPAEHFDEVSGLFTEAMNSNLQSPNVPIALLNLGLINLWVGNLPEAKAYFDILSTEYPYDQGVPTIGFHYGEYYYRQGDYEKAADLFQRFIETYPEQERLARRAAYLLADSLSRLGMFDQAFQIVDYIDKRWPQAYEENPGFLKLAGDIEYRLGMLDQAKGHYWTYYNMNPKAEASDVVLARLGDIYLESDEQRAAKELYNRAIFDYPDMEGGLISKMRLAEEGIHDEPSFMEMVTVFDGPYSLRPKQVYTEIVDEHPDSPLAPLALLKLGMWHFFQKEYAEALAAAQRMFTDYPRSPLAERAKELGDKSFALAVPELLDKEDYQLVVDYWERYDFANMSEGSDANATRIGVAKSYAELDEYDTALNLLEPFMGEEQVDPYSEMALAVAANVFVDQHAWNRISELAEKVETNWDLSDRARRLMLHAEAMAMENLGEADKAVRLWAQLGSDEAVEPFIRADAMYHLAKEAMNHQDLRRVFVYAQEALSQLLAVDGDEEKIKDCLLMSIYATERSGRYEQALEWALEYDKYIPQDNPEWAANRYRLARIYRKAGADKEWKEILEGIRDAEPESLYGRLSATAIETNVLEERAQEYAPIPN